MEHRFLTLKVGLRDKFEAKSAASWTPCLAHRCTCVFPYQRARQISENSERVRYGQSVEDRDVCIYTSTQRRGVAYSQESSDHRLQLGDVWRYTQHPWVCCPLCRAQIAGRGSSHPKPVTTFVCQSCERRVLVEASCGTRCSLATLGGRSSETIESLTPRHCPIAA
jgi:hypothetical protein